MYPIGTPFLMTKPPYAERSGSRRSGRTPTRKSSTPRPGRAATTEVGSACVNV